MEFEIDQSRFISALGLAQTVADKRSNNQPILANVLLRATKDNKLVCSATDMMISVTETIPVEVKTPGSLTLGVRYLHNVVRTLAIAKWDEWLRKYAPPGAASYDFYQSLPALSQGNVAQQIFCYTAFTADMVKPKSEGNNTVDDEGNPLWRMAPSPHGPYWQEGQKVGYQDGWSWTILKSTPEDRAKAAWLYAQFAVSKTVDVKKSHVGLTFIRDSTVRHESFTERAPKLGGLVEFYRSPDRVRWSPTGINVPDYPKLAQIFVRVARDLLGKTLVTLTEGKLTSGLIVETEAYSYREDATHLTIR